jgi:hypothetical protein
MEVSYHLVEQVCFCTATAVAQGGYGDGGFGENGYGDPVGALFTVSSQTAMYVGALIIIGWGLTTAEVVTITEINADGTILTTATVNAHNAGETILAPTFPTQAPTDPFYTIQEMLGYLSRAQNEFLTECGTYFQLFQQSVTYGQIIQSTPPTAIEIERVALSTFYSAIATITIASNVATVVTVDPHGLQVGSTIYIQNPTAGFGGCFQVASVPSTTSLTCKQVAANSSATGGAIIYFSRLYETTSAEITMTDRTWRNDYVQNPSQWYEDRTGLYKWGVNGRPASNFPVELLCTVRDTDTLGLLDGFLIPDTLCYILKHKVLAFAFMKDGVAQDPARAAYCEQRYRRGVMAVQRYLRGMEMGLKGGERG